MAEAESMGWVRQVEGVASSLGKPAAPGLPPGRFSLATCAGIGGRTRTMGYVAWVATTPADHAGFHPSGGGDSPGTPACGPGSLTGGGNGGPIVSFGR